MLYLQFDNGALGKIEGRGIGAAGLLKREGSARVFFSRIFNIRGPAST